MKTMYIIFNDIILHRYNFFVSKLILMLASSYILVKKLFDFSFSSFIFQYRQKIFLQEDIFVFFYDYIVDVCMVFVILSIVVQFFSMFYDSSFFSKLKCNFVEPRDFCDCLSTINEEIMEHLDTLKEVSFFDVKNISSLHKFRRNVTVVVTALARYLCKIKGIENREEDVFISLYEYKKENNELAYVWHYYPHSDRISHEFIKLDDSKYEKYEMVKCLKSENTTVCVSDRKQYEITNCNRLKTFRQYIGCKIQLQGNTVGFLNIEFHNNSLFLEKGEMQDFVIKYVTPFKLLIEYQYLKSFFFKQFKSFESGLSLRWFGIK